jgi:hypothetical protein
MTALSPQVDVLAALPAESLTLGAFLAVCRLPRAELVAVVGPVEYWEVTALVRGVPVQLSVQTSKTPSGFVAESAGRGGRRRLYLGVAAVAGLRSTRVRADFESTCSAALDAYVFWRVYVALRSLKLRLEGNREMLPALDRGHRA